MLLFMSLAAVAQNTKGDRPGNTRETRFKGGGKSKQKVSIFKRLKARGGEKAGRPIRPVYSVKKPSNRERAWKGDISGRRVRNKNTSSTDRGQNIYPQNNGGLVRRSPPSREGRQNVTITRTRRIRPSSSERASNVYPNRGPYVNNSSPKPRDNQRSVSNRSTLARLKTLQSLPSGSRPRRSSKVAPRSASRAYLSGKSINVFARFKRPKKKGERAQTTDLAGRRIRTKNYETRRPGLLTAPNIYQGRKKNSGDRAYSGNITPRMSYPKGNARPWKGDLTHRNLRHKNRKSGISGVTPVFGRKNLSGSAGIKRSGLLRIPTRKPGIGANGINTSGSRKRIAPYSNQGESFSGVFKKRRPLKGGGSVSGRLWNNEGRAVPGSRRGMNINAIPPGTRTSGKAPFRPQGSGFMQKRRDVAKTNINSIPKNQRRSYKEGTDQGEGFSGLIRNRRSQRGANINVIPKSQRRKDRNHSDQGEEFSGTIKSRRPFKTGGSVSGKLWNNDGRAIVVKRSGREANINTIPYSQRRKEKTANDQGEEYAGNIKTRRVLKGGGSVSGKLWNNNSKPIESKTYSGQGRITGYSGNIKATKPKKGGESISGNLWNNEEKPIAVKRPPGSAFKQGTYTGNIKQNLYKSRFRDQGEEFTGVLKLAWWKRNYIQNKKAYEESMRKVNPGKGIRKVEGLQVRVQRRDYIRNPNSAEEALLKLRPTKTTKEVNELHVRVKSFKYQRNASSVAEALKVREPGKAFARATDYQGNIKMQKYRLFEKNRNLHPDSRFVKTNRNNVQEEKDALTNLKLWWARLFKKQETQPEHLKEKGKQPRYDKGEQGLWYD